jgi:hypothetical protein
MTWFRSGDASMVGRLKPLGFGLLSLVARPAGWAVGFGMGYRRGVNDAKLGDIIKAVGQSGVRATGPHSVAAFVMAGIR